MQKLSDIGIGANIPGSPFNIGLSEKQVRLPGMNRFVPRGMLEMAYQGTDAGAAPEELLGAAREQGSLKHPLLGALMGGYAAHKYLPSSGAPGKALAALLGAGLGDMYNKHTADDREQGMHESLKGVAEEKRQLQGTAHEALPLFLSSTGQSKLSTLASLALNGAKPPPSWSHGFKGPVTLASKVEKGF